MSGPDDAGLQKRIAELEAVVKLAGEALSDVQGHEATVGQIDTALEACYAALPASAWD